MFLLRCAWHRRYHGYTKVLGISRGRGWAIQFSDGMCAGCAARARAEYRLPSSALSPGLKRRRVLSPTVAIAMAASVMVIVGVAVGPQKRPVTSAVEEPKTAAAITTPAADLSSTEPRVDETPVASAPEPVTIAEETVVSAPPPVPVRRATVVRTRERVATPSMFRTARGTTSTAAPAPSSMDSVMPSAIPRAVALPKGSEAP